MTAKSNLGKLDAPKVEPEGEPRKKRMRFVQDDDSHWYAIPANEEHIFRDWVAVSHSIDSYFNNEDFDKYRIDGGPEHYTFTDLKRSPK